MKTTKIIAAMLTLVILISAVPISAQAAPPPNTWTKVMTEKQLADHNLSLGVIRWNDSIVKGQITVTARKDGNYDVKMEEYFQMNDMKNSKKAKAKWHAQQSFKGMRDYCQSKGWWDCNFKIKSTTATKVTATAKIEYKAVKIDEQSKEITAKITWQKKERLVENHVHCRQEKIYAR